jgi:hypothetical protein
MLRTEHVAATWIAVLLLAGCSREKPQQEAMPGMASGAVAGAMTPADAAGPNRMLDPASFSDPHIREAYAAARKHAQVLEHLYCYCHCKENFGHRALAECFESDHGANCDICMTEALIAARMADAGRSAKEIQAAIDVYYRG